MTRTFGMYVRQVLANRSRHTFCISYNSAILDTALATLPFSFLEAIEFIINKYRFWFWWQNWSRVLPPYL